MTMLVALADRLNPTSRRTTLQPPLAYCVTEFGRLFVIRTEKRRLRIIFRSGQVEAFRHSRGTWLLRESRAPSRPGGPLQRFDLGCSNRRRTDRIWLLRSSGSSGSYRRPVRSNQASRAAARARALLNTVGSCLDPTFAAGPSPVVASRAVLTVNVLGSARFRRCCAALGVVRVAGAIARVSMCRRLIRRAV